MKGSNLGSLNPKWKGDLVGYFGLHTWVSRRLGRAEQCKNCGHRGNCVWANKSRLYIRSIVDWVSLCQSCHKEFDGLTKIAREDIPVVRFLYKSGHKQKELAAKFGVHQSTISLLINKKLIRYA